MNENKEISLKDEILLMNDLQLQILNSKASHQRRIFEGTNFNIQKAPPLLGQRILTMLENSLIKMDLVSALPWLCSSLVEGNPELEYILGPKCIQPLVRLMTAQMAWREAKSGRKIPTGRSSLSPSRTLSKCHMMEGNVKLEEEDDEMKPSREEEDNNVTTFGLPTTPTNTNPVNEVSSSLKRDGKTKTGKGKKMKGRDVDRMIEMLGMDESKFTFLSNLIRTSDGDETKSPSKGEGVDAHTKQGKNILRLIRLALHSKYEDHVRKALKDKDSKGLLCMLSMLQDSHTSNLFTRHSSHQEDQKGFPRDKISRDRKKLKIHKNNCRKLNKESSFVKDEEDDEDSNEMDNIDQFLITCLPLEREELEDEELSSQEESSGTVNESESDKDSEEDEEQEQVLSARTCESRTQQILRIPYYSRSKSNPSNQSSYDDDDNPVQSVDSQVKILEKEEDDEEDQARASQDMKDSIEEGRNGDESQRGSPNLSTFGETIDDEAFNLQTINLNTQDEEFKNENQNKLVQYWEAKVREEYKEACNQISLNSLAVEKIMKIHQTLESPTWTLGFHYFRTLFKALYILMADRLATSLEQDLILECKLRELWSNEKRYLSQFRKLQKELKELEDYHGPHMLTLDFQIRILTRRLRQVANENFVGIRNVIRETQLNSAIADKREMTNVELVEKRLINQQDKSLMLKKRHNLEELNFKNIRNDLNMKLKEEIARYDEMAFKLQNKLDSIVEETVENELVVNSIKLKFENVRERYVDMKGTEKLRQIRRNMQLADESKRERAAKVIQDFWRHYKIRKRKREKRKGRKGGKKKGKAK